MPVPPEETSQAGRRIAIICAIVGVLIVVIYVGNIIAQSKEVQQQREMSRGTRQ